MNRKTCIIKEIKSIVLDQQILLEFWQIKKSYWIYERTFLQEGEETQMQDMDAVYRQHAQTPAGLQKLAELIK